MISKAIYLGVGSNLGNREGHLSEAQRLLNVSIVRGSPVYETEPVGLIEQPWFLNVVWEIETNLGPRDLLNRCQEVERQMGRTRWIPKGPRVIDLDILFYNDTICDEPDLIIPHREIARRRFVLAPMNDLAPDFVHPVLQKTIAQLLVLCVDQSVVRRL